MIEKYICLFNSDGVVATFSFLSTSPAEIFSIAAVTAAKGQEKKKNVGRKKSVDLAGVGWVFLEGENVALSAIRIEI